MFEKIIKPKDFKLLLYIAGAFLEVIGFGLLFAFDKTIVILNEYKIIYAVILIIAGYLLAVKNR